MHINHAIHILLKQPTKEGAKAIKELLGLKRFMMATDADKYPDISFPDMTPELYEKLLPYAIALGVENKWAAKLEDAIGTEAVEHYMRNNSHYVGAHGGWSGGSTALSGALAGSIVAASTSPVSASAFGGGGGAGGGGGGGGGGGW